MKTIRLSLAAAALVVACAPAVSTGTMAPARTSNAEVARMVGKLAREFISNVRA